MATDVDRHFWNKSFLSPMGVRGLRSALYISQLNQSKDKDEQSSPFVCNFSKLEVTKSQNLTLSVSFVSFVPDLVWTPRARLRGGGCFGNFPFSLSSAGRFRQKGSLKDSPPAKISQPELLAKGGTHLTSAHPQKLGGLLGGFTRDIK